MISQEKYKIIAVGKKGGVMLYDELNLPVITIIKVRGKIIYSTL